MALVRTLLAQQHPDLARLSIAPVAAGWDNSMFRLGDSLSVRLPRRAAAAGLILNEQRWLPGLAPHLPLPVPAPVRVGVPGAAYPWAWSVLPWLEGGPADLDVPGDDQGEVLGGFFKALHGQPLPADAPKNPYRGVPLSQRRAILEPQIARVAERGAYITPAVRETWERALAAPMDADPVWLQGDPHGKNVLTVQGRITAMIDWGDMCGGDPACDLAAFWMLLEKTETREQALATYGGISEATRLRARGWTAAFGVMLLDAGLADDPRLAAMGERALRRLGDRP